MNKTELVSAVAEKAGMTKKDAEKALSAVLGSIEAALATGDKVQLVGFGTFEVRSRAARTGRTLTGVKSKSPISKYLRNQESQRML